MGVELIDCWAIKIGGSLYESQYLQAWLETISDISNKKIIIVPGGGPFADQVRKADDKFSLQSKYSHAMAVMAMQQYAGVLKSLSPALIGASSVEKIQQTLNASQVTLWEPYEMVRDQCRLAESWEISSDSLAVWLAGTLKIKNVLFVKSSNQVLDDPGLDRLIDNQCIDPGIKELANNKLVDIHFMHHTKAADLQTLLNSA